MTGTPPQEEVDMRHTGHLTVIALCTLALAVAGCSSSETSSSEASSPEAPAAAASWTTGQEVVDSVTEAGFDCSFDASTGGEQIASIEVEGGTLTNVTCKGFDVMLFDSMDVMDQQVGLACASVTEQDMAAPDFAAPVVQGETFFISGTETAGGFPAAAQPDALTAAFGGDQISVSDVFDRVCG